MKGDRSKYRGQCPVPCHRLNIQIHHVSKDRGSDKGIRGVHVGAKFEFPYEYRTLQYLMLYTTSDFIAAVGGNLGLFLGLSLFGLVDLLQCYLLERRNVVIDGSEEDEKSGEDAEENDIALDCLPKVIKT